MWDYINTPIIMVLSHICHCIRTSVPHYLTSPLQVVSGLFCQSGPFPSHSCSGFAYLSPLHLNDHWVPLCWSPVILGHLTSEFCNHFTSGGVGQGWGQRLSCIRNVEHTLLFSPHSLDESRLCLLIGLFWSSWLAEGNLLVWLISELKGQVPIQASYQHSLTSYVASWPLPKDWHKSITGNLLKSTILKFWCPERRSWTLMRF